MILKWGLILAMGLSLASCLKTRAEVGEDEQSQVYGKKNVENQQAEAKPSQISQGSSKGQPAVAVDERDDLIRSLNGRLESLENQISALNKEKNASSDQSTQKVQLLQEALTKMEAQIQKLENEQKINEMAAPPPRRLGQQPQSSDKNAASVAVNAYDVGQELFMKKEWKKAILNYQKYVDESPKGKNAPDARYKIGVCFQELGMKEEAMAFYEEVIANSGKTEAGKKSKLRLAKLKK